MPRLLLLSKWRLILQQRNKLTFKIKIYNYLFKKNIKTSNQNIIMINFEQKTIWSLSYADVQFHGYIINTGIYMYN